MQIGIPQERLEHENRVSASPASVTALIKLGFSVVFEKGAGVKASFTDEGYRQAGAELVSSEQAWQSDIILKVNKPEASELEQLKPGATLVSFIGAAQNPDLLAALAERKLNVLAMDAVPRMSRSQSLDALSSMANIAGYRAVIEAAHHFGRFFTGQITAAGNMPPARIMIIGAGVAGLAAIGAASAMGAIVRAFDTRPEVKEQIESMGAEFLELDFSEQDAAGEEGKGDGYAKQMSQAFIDAEMALFAAQAKEVDIIITTAMIPGKPSPKLLSAELVKSMRPGSVIVDLAAPGGGNCELTVPGKMVNKHGVKVLGYTDLVSRLPSQSSQLYANNLVNLLKLLCPEKNGEIDINFNDVVIRAMTVVKSGEITWPPPALPVSAAPPPQAAAKPEATKPVAQDKPASNTRKHLAMLAGAALFAWIADAAPAEFLSHFTVFVLACVVGYHVVWNVSHSLHTPLMSVTNAISGIIVVGALLQVGSDNWLVWILAAIATLIASINVFGGFVVTRRMLKMFRE